MTALLLGLLLEGLPVSAYVRSIINLGNTGIMVDIECQTSNSLPNIAIVDFANKTVDESKECIWSTFTNSQVQLFL